MEPTDTLSKIAKRLSELEAAMRLPAGIRLDEYHEVQSMRRELALLQNAQQEALKGGGDDTPQL